MNNLDNLGGYFIPNTLDGINIVTETVSNDALLVDGTNMMLADIDMNFHVLKNLDPGIADTESVNVSQLNAKANILYVDARDNLYDASMGLYVRNQDTLYDASMVSYTNSKFLNKTTTDVADGIKIWQNIQIHSAVSAPNSEQSNETTIFHSRDLSPKWSEGITASNNDFIISRWTAPGTSNDVIKLRHTTNDIQINQPITMSSQKITNLANGATGNDAVNYIQLSAKADTSYVIAQDVAYDASMGLYVRAQDTLYDASMGLYVRAQDTLYDASMTTYVNTLDAQNVKLTGTQSIAGSKTFQNGIIINSASPQLTISNGGTNAFSWTQGGGGTVTQTASGNMIFNSTAGSTFFQSNTVPKLTISSTGALLAGSLDMNTTNKIINLANGTNANDAVNKNQLDLKADTTYVNTQDALRLLKAGDTMTGALSMNTTNKITNLANGTAPTDAINKGQMDTEFTAKERTRPQAQYCKAWRKVGGVDTSINVMGIGWSVGIHQDSVSGGSTWGLEHTPVNDGVFLRVDVPLYKGDVVNGFFFASKAPDDNGSVVKIFVYDFGDNKLATTEASTCANQNVVYCPFTTAWTVPSTQTYRVCIVWQSGGVNHVLSTISGWVGFFNNMATSYNNTYINQTNKTPPDFYDLVDVPLTRNSIVYAYRTI